ncbi:MAG: ROK family protein [Bacteroidales bacterium]|jgi:glucokinase|nr:ROK family protein [Bacteroidales bacterium]
MERNLAIGADIGGSHISCAAVDLLTGKILKETLTGREVNNQAHANVIIKIWANALTEAMAKVPAEQVKGIGFAMPGPFDYVKGISYIKGVTKYENLYGMNITDAISSSLEVPEDFLIRFMNDASSFAVGEAWAGSAADADRSLSITLGTGFGSAFVSRRIPVVDGSEVPKLGCIYHIPYRDGIADDYFSTRWFTGQYKNLTGKEMKGVRELSELAATDKTALDLFTDFGTRLAIFLAPFLLNFRAEILVIGGNISHAYNLFGDRFEETLKKEKCNCRVALSALKEDAAILGSAYMLDDEFWKSIQHALPLM